jgi:hypothetical protein
MCILGSLAPRFKTVGRANAETPKDVDRPAPLGCASPNHDPSSLSNFLVVADSPEVGRRPLYSVIFLHLHCSNDASRRATCQTSLIPVITTFLVRRG